MDESLIKLVCTAYTVEQKSLDILNRHRETADHGCMEDKINSHIVETQWQGKLLKACLEFHDIDEVPFDAKAHKLAAKIGKISLFAFENFEVSLYKKIISAAKEAQALEILNACREILEQEKSMVEWLEDNSLNSGHDFIKQERGSLFSLDA